MKKVNICAEAVRSLR
ncbi:hypothetical protein Hamer_G009138 [Homarus americanus]|uniref:Uncharacterized protein n=1 Tax=Homarus americanus TaxID=6706 RepID=A0A8J5TP70_HOMAM|nr:hypothetical protein Hamer_G009138 [Homarus americanus]